MTMNRRTFVIHSILGSAALATASLSQAQAAKVSETDAQAVALAYKEDGTKTDKVKFPKHTAEQKCAGCQLYAGAATGYGNCGLFPGKQVAAAGWCSAYAKKG